MAAHNDLGTWGEVVAADYLRKKGYTILEQDWKSGHRDIDLIAIDGNTVVFIEVKTRRNRVFGEPEDAVNYMKLRNLRTAINHYIKYKRLNNDIRFDVVSVIGTPETGAPEIKHFEDVPMF
jgi:putative endonuclease